MRISYYLNDRNYQVHPCPRCGSTDLSFDAGMLAGVIKCDSCDYRIFNDTIFECMNEWGCDNVPLTKDEKHKLVVDELKQARKDLEAAQGVMDAYDRVCEAKDRTIEGLQQELVEARGENVLKALRAVPEVVKMEKRIQELENESQRLKDWEERAVKSMDKASEAAKVLCCDLIPQRIERLQALLDAANDEIRDDGIEIERLRTSYEKVRECNEEHEQDCIDLQKRIEALEAEAWQYVEDIKAVCDKCPDVMVELLSRLDIRRDEDE